jgi:hypothetical protein
MHTHGTTSPAALKEPQRVNFYYGQLLDAYHFNLETGYQNEKRWLLNRLILGWGVVCGLDVRGGDCDEEVIVGAGVALDGWGREIIVPEEKHVRLPIHDVVHENCAHHDRHEHWLTIWLCYHECQACPTPVIASECDTERCMPGAIRESYCIEPRPGRVESCPLPDPDGLICEGQIRHRDLIQWVSRCCDAPPEEPCIPLATIRFWHQHEHCHCGEDDVDISVRPVVFTNRLLAMLLMGQHGGANRTSRPRY